MTDPYQILGIDRNATDEEVKKAYRAMSRKYHPDANINNPRKDEAEAKFKEVQQAYQKIMDEREHGGGNYYNGNPYENYGNGNPFGGYGSPFGSYGGYGSSGSYGGYGNAGSSGGYRSDSESDPYLRAAANYIQSGHYQEALHVLDGIRDRSALWYFYSASANSGIGNNVTALEHAKEAVRLEPNNMQYQMMLQHLQNGGSWYQQKQNMYGYPTMGSDYCIKLCVANIMCNLCCGGGAVCC